MKNETPGLVILGVSNPFFEHHVLPHCQTCQHAILKTPFYCLLFSPAHQLGRLCIVLLGRV